LVDVTLAEKLTAMGYKLLMSGLILFLGVGKGLDSLGQAPDDSAFLRRLADVVLTDGKAYGDLRILTKTVGARLSGSPGYYKAEVWGQKALQDAAADKVWLQECMVPHWVRGGKDSASFSSDKGGAAGATGGLWMATVREWRCR